MEIFLDTPLFGIIISIVAFNIGLLVAKKTKKPIFNPLLIGIIIVISVIMILNIDIDFYNKGGSYISFFLGPATVILAVPLYSKLDLLKKSLIPILSGITVGCISAVSSVWILAKLFNLEEVVRVSMVPRSVTTPIALEVSKQIGGIPSLTVAVVVITGILGAVIGPTVCKIFRIKDEVAVGVSIGTASHAVGTSKAMELGETQGAMSGLSIGIAGLITVFIAPIVMKFL